MRRAAAEILIAKTLVNHVFQPFYVPKSLQEDEGGSSDSDDGEELRDAADAMLRFLAGDEQDELRSNEHSQAIYRFHVLRRLEPLREQARSDVLFAATDELQVLDKLVRPADRGRLDEPLEALLGDAMDLWARVQRLRALVTAELPTEDDGGLLGREGYGARADRGGSNPAPAGARRHVECALFPRVVDRRPAADHVLYRGVVLWGDQPHLIAARDQEARELAAPAPAGAGVGARRNSLRRPSIPTAKSPVSSRARQP